ncbi:MAG TPA: hypothetical protein VH092_24355 [Urbifossiella sp.]|jgi:hypothetical protein|nr:hypothetical protein [Urbifossiella sp.]
MGAVPPAVRVLPMDSGEPGFAGCTIEEVQQQFFLGELARPSRSPGRYSYRKVGLRAEPGTVVLFQFAGRIVASATLLEAVRYDEPQPGGHAGEYHFDVSTIRVFDPVDAEALGKIWPQVTRLGQAKWTLNPEHYGEFERLQTGVESPRV